MSAEYSDLPSGAQVVSSPTPSFSDLPPGAKVVSPSYSDLPPGAQVVAHPIQGPQAPVSVMAKSRLDPAQDAINRGLAESAAPPSSMAGDINESLNTPTIPVSNLIDEQKHPIAKQIVGGLVDQLTTPTNLLGALAMGATMSGKPRRAAPVASEAKTAPMPADPPPAPIAPPEPVQAPPTAPLVDMGPRPAPKPPPGFVPETAVHESVNTPVSVNTRAAPVPPPTAAEAAGGKRLSAVRMDGKVYEAPEGDNHAAPFRKMVEEFKAKDPVMAAKIDKGEVAPEWGTVNTATGEFESYTPKKAEPAPRRVSNLQVNSSELRDVITPEDVPRETSRKIAAQRNINGLLDDMDHTEGAGGVGRWKQGTAKENAMANYGQEGKSTGIKSPVPPELQRNLWSELRRAAKQGLAGETFKTPTGRAWPKGAELYQKIETWALRKDGPIDETDLAEHGVLPKSGSSETAAEREAIVSEGQGVIRQPEPAPDFIKGQEATQAAAEGRGLKGLTTEQPTGAPEKVFDKGLANKNKVRLYNPFSGGYHGQNQIMEAAPESAQALRAAAGAYADGQYGVTQAAEQIEKQVGKGAWQRFKDVATQEQIEGMKTKARESGTFDPSEFKDHMDQASYQKAIEGPLYKKAGRIWDNEVGNDLTAAHAANEGRMLQPQHMGPSGRYFPLAGAVEDQGGLYAPRPGFEKPRNPLNRTRTGQGTFDTTDETLQKRVGSAQAANKTAAAIDQMERDGLIKPIIGASSDKTFPYDGRTFTASNTGTHVMPNWVKDEAGPILERGEPVEQNKFARGITKLSTMGVGPIGAERAFHTINQIGVLTAEAPTLGTSRFAKTVGNLPVAKTVNAITQLFKSIPEEDAPLVRQMRANGEWTPRFDDNGKLWSMSKTDLKARVAFRKALQGANPNMTNNDFYEASTHLGEYNSKLAPNMIRSIKGSEAGVAMPFMTAGNAIGRGSFNALKMGAGGVGGAGSKALAAIGGSIPAALGTWAGLHKGITGKFPDPSDPDFKLGQIKYGETEDGKAKYVNILRLVSPIGGRGLTASGIKDFIETLSRGGTVAQAADTAQGAIIGSQVHQFAGPPVQFATRAAGGIDPGIQIKGGQFETWKSHGPTPPGEQTRANIMSALKGINPGVAQAAKGGEGLSVGERVLKALGIISTDNTGRRREVLQRDAEKWANRGGE